MIDAKLEELLVLHEGWRRKPYRDSVGKLTIGVGRNLDDVGLSDDEVLYLLRNDINRVKREMWRRDWFNDLDPVRQTVIIDMAFNLGPAGVDGFRKMIAALRAKDYERAAEEMLNSRWAEQVGQRAVTLARMMRTGEYAA